MSKVFLIRLAAPVLLQRSKMTILVLTALISKGMAQGIPEPDLIMYGTVLNARSNANFPLGYGPLTCVFKPSGGGLPIAASTALSNLGNQLSFILRVPCETPVAGYTNSPHTIQLTAAGTSFDRSQTTWFGTNFLSFIPPALSSTSVSSLDRGRIERADLAGSLPITLDPQNGLLPVDWELYYFGQRGISPYSDPDGDGMNNLAEYLAGTDPTDPTSALRFIGITKFPDGVQLEWHSAPYRAYTIQRSSNLISGFSDIETNIPATPPLNLFWDTNNTSEGPAFYRLQVEP